MKHRKPRNLLMFDPQRGTFRGTFRVRSLLLHSVHFVAILIYDEKPYLELPLSFHHGYKDFPCSAWR
jgi:hypothetical protein